MRIVQIASEIVPFSKTGGLADVVGAVSDALARRGHQVMTVSPKYGNVDAQAHGFRPTDITPRIDVSWRTWRPRYWVRHSHNRTDVLVESALYDRPGIYGDSHGAFGDNHVRFALLARAGIEAARWVPAPQEPLGEGVVFHVHDWHAALVPTYLNATYRPLGLFPHAPTVITLHNVGHQGMFSGDRFADLELPPRWNSAWCLEWFSGINLLKSGVLQAEAITTVSDTYAKEILYDDGAFGMEGPLRSRARDLVGIRNGIDAQVWNPATDPYLDARYHADDMAGKARCKAALQAEVGLPVNEGAPLLGNVGRLDPQKGVQILIDSIPWMVETHGAQVVVLGSAGAANRHLEYQLKALEQRYPRHVRAVIGFSERMAHRIEAGADLFLMPSLFEPCGLNQLYSLRYGTPPIVNSTGGLVDSVQPHDPRHDSGTGWLFSGGSPEGFREALHWALVTWKNFPESFRRVQHRGMTQDLSWDAVIPRYETVYRYAASKLAERG